MIPWHVRVGLISFAAMQSMMSLDIIGGNSVVQQVRLAALLPEGKLIFAVKALDLGGMPVGVPQTSIVTLKNVGVHDATFQVSQDCRQELDFARTGLCDLQSRTGICNLLVKA